MIVSSIETEDGIVPDIPEEVEEYVIRYTRLPDGTYKLVLDPVYVVAQHENRVIAAELRVEKLLEALEESDIPEIREVATKVEERTPPDRP